MATGAFEIGSLRGERLLADLAAELLEVFGGQGPELGIGGRAGGVGADLADGLEVAEGAVAVDLGGESPWFVPRPSSSSSPAGTSRPSQRRSRRRVQRRRPAARSVSRAAGGGGVDIGSAPGPGIGSPHNTSRTPS